MKKILLSIAILMSILIVTVGCSSKDVFELNLTPENKVEKLSRSDYIVRMREVFKESSNLMWAGSEKLSKTNKIYKELEENLPAKYDEEISLGNYKIFFITSKYTVEEYSKFTCTDEDIAKAHKKLIALEQEDFNNKLEIGKMLMSDTTSSEEINEDTIKEIKLRQKVFAESLYGDLKACQDEINSLVGINMDLFSNTDDESLDLYGN